VRTLVIGIGNTLLGDDGVGVHVVRRLEPYVQDASVDFAEASTDGLNLIDLILGYEKLIVVDAIMTCNVGIGRIYRLSPGQVMVPSSTASPPHHFNLCTALQLGRQLFPEDMPCSIVIYAISIENVLNVSEEMSHEANSAVRRLLPLILAELRAEPAPTPHPSPA
jgi:hydrogenase maturation protease